MKKKEIKFTLLAVILIALFCIALTPVTFQNDTYYTIKVGEHIARIWNRWTRSIFLA